MEKPLKFEYSNVFGLNIQTRMACIFQPMVEPLRFEYSNPSGFNIQTLG